MLKQPQEHVPEAQAWMDKVEEMKDRDEQIEVAVLTKTFN